MTHYILFPQLVVFSRETTTLLRKEYVISIKVSSYAIMQKSLLQKSVTLPEKIRDFIKSCKKPKLFDLLIGLKIGFFN